MRYLIFILALLSLSLVLLASACNRGSTSQQSADQGGQEQTFSDSQSAAARGLETFRKLVTNENFKEMGFESMAEVSNASLGEPRHVFAVGLEQLKGFAPGGDANRLLTDANQELYPVMVGDQARASVTVEQRDGKWRATSFGSSRRSRQLAQASRSLTQSAEKPIIVHVQAFNLYFLGQRSDNRLMLTPLADYSSYNLRAGATASADDIFAALVPIAREYNGLPL